MENPSGSGAESPKMSPLNSLDANQPLTSTRNLSREPPSVNGDSQGTHTGKVTQGALIRGSRRLRALQALQDSLENIEVTAQEKEEPVPETHGTDTGNAHEEGSTATTADVPVNGKKADTTAVLTRLHEVTPEKVRWVWRDRIPLAKLTLLDGDPGNGKSLISLDVAARASIFKLMPDGTKGDLSAPAGVVLLSAEDDPADTIRPRLDAVGADCTKIVILKAVREKEHEHLPTLLDIAAIRDAITEVSAKLVVIDPLMAYLPGKTDSHRDQDVRSVLALLAKLAAETGAAILIIRHLNKTESGNVLYRGGGSIGIIGAARSGLVVARDPEDEEQRVLAATKSNLARLASSLSYTIEAVDDVPRIKWGVASTHTAATLLAQQADSSEDRSALDDAQEFLRALLGKEKREAKEIYREARSAGISEATLRRAKTALRIRPRHEGKPLSADQRWMWALPEGAQPPPEDAQPPPEDAHTLELEHLRANTEKNSRNDANLPEGAQGSECEHLQSAHEHLQGDVQEENQGPLAGAEVFE